MWISAGPYHGSLAPSFEAPMMPHSQNSLEHDPHTSALCLSPDPNKSALSFQKWGFLYSPHLWLFLSRLQEALRNHYNDQILLKQKVRWQQLVFSSITTFLDLRVSEWRKARFWYTQAWIIILALLSTSYVTLGKSLNFSELYCLQL